MLLYCYNTPWGLTSGLWAVLSKNEAMMSAAALASAYSALAKLDVSYQKACVIICEPFVALNS
jgi:hypothetical protein